MALYSQAPWPTRPKLGVWVAKSLSCDRMDWLFFSGEPPPPPPPWEVCIVCTCLSCRPVPPRWAWSRVSVGGVHYCLGVMILFVVWVWVGDTIPVKCFSRCWVFSGIGFGPKSGDGRHDLRTLRGLQLSCQILASSSSKLSGRIHSVNFS